MNKIIALGKVPIGIALAIAMIVVLSVANTEVIVWASLLAVAAASWELASLIGRKVMQRASMSIAVVISCLLCRWLLSDSREALNEFLLMSVMFWIVFAPIWLAINRQPNKLVLSVLGSFAFISAWLSIAVLAEYDRGLLMIGIAAVCLIDTSAAIVGKAWGRVKLAPQISPNKTYEGVIGAMLTSYVMALVVWSLYLSDSYPHWLILLLAAAICGLAVLGDLIESLIKRHADVKDSGKILGSHGGLLDRIDSWLPVLPFLALISAFIT